MKPLFLFLLVLPVAVQATPLPVQQSEIEAQRAHATGACGRLGAGTGLTSGKGWVVSMLPGRHQFRMRGSGAVHVTVARLTEIDFDAGRPYYIVIEDAGARSILEWKTPGSDWAPVSNNFLYPVQR